MKTRVVLLTLIAIVLASAVNASQPESVSKEFRSLAPRQVLPLMHAPEIHQELKFSKTQVADLESLFSEIDGPWFQSRNLPLDRQNQILDSLDDRVQNWLTDHATKDQRERLSLTLKQLRGKVVLVHFYAFQCHNCHANFEIYRRWHEQLQGKGVEVIGIQTPETPQERDPVAVKSAAASRKLDFPILVDLESKNWAAWGNTMWPTVYVIDKNGYIRHWWQGELNWKGATADKTIENVVQQLLDERVGDL